MLRRILGSLLVVFVCWDIKPVFYAIWSPFVWLMGYSDPRRPTTDKLYGTTALCCIHLAATHQIVTPVRQGRMCVGNAFCKSAPHECK